MKDQIVAAYLSDFTKEYGLAGLEESEAFEHFVNYCTVSKHHPDAFEPEDVAVAGGGDLGLDGLAVLVNDHIVISIEGVDYLKKALRRLDVEFIFVQAKTSPHFEGGDIGTFLSGVRQFFEPVEPAGVNDRIRELYQVKQHIIASSIDMDGKPGCRLYFATTGTWLDESVLRSRVDQGVGDLKKTGLFDSVQFVPLDAEGLKRVYREVHHKIIREIEFSRHTILPDITGVQEAYIGIVPCTEYLKLISDEDGSLNRRLFYDNVRDFQGHNPVNREIEATVKDPNGSDRFALLNNGVTIVARDVNKIGVKFRLKDYQIVNGCQTSHILHLNRTRLTPGVYLPIKLIVTGDSEITSQVTQGTNRQTEVKLEAFESLAPFQKNLEEFYLAMARDKANPIYYERRSKQYEHLGLRRERIVTLAGQVKCFLAMFLNEPHSTHRYYGELLSAYRNRLFNEAHSPWPYYLSGVALSTVEALFFDGLLPRAWRPRKFQLMMVWRLQHEPSDLPVLNSKAMEKYCDVLLKRVENSAQLKADLTAAGELVEKVRRDGSPWREPPDRTKVFTTRLIAAASNGRDKRGATTAVSTGTVKWFSEVRGYGFIINDEDGEELFVHYRDINAPGYRNLVPQQRVRYSTVQTAKGMQAVGVEPA